MRELQDQVQDLLVPLDDDDDDDQRSGSAPPARSAVHSRS